MRDIHKSNGKISVLSLAIALSVLEGKAEFKIVDDDKSKRKAYATPKELRKAELM